MVRVHRGSVLGDAFQVRMGQRVHIADCVTAIEREGNGVILFLPGHPDPETDLAFYLNEPIARPPESKKHEAYCDGSREAKHSVYRCCRRKFTNDACG